MNIESFAYMHNALMNISRFSQTNDAPYEYISLFNDGNGIGDGQSYGSRRSAGNGVGYSEEYRSLYEPCNGNGTGYGR